MATEDDKAQDGWYRFTGMKNKWDETSSLVLEGSAIAPKVVINKGDPVELTGDQVEAAKNMGARLSPVSDDRVKTLEEEQQDEESSAPRGSEQRPAAETGSTQPADVARAADEKSSGGSGSKSKS